MAWLGTWKHRIKISIDADDVSANLTNFPVLLVLSATSGISDDDITCIFDELGSDANRTKIAVTTSDGTTQCYVEIESWSHATELAYLWVKVPAVDATTDTDLYIYYDDEQAANTTYVGDTNSTPAENVWDANYKAVHHLNETATTSKDSTSGNHDLDWVNHVDDVAGKIALGHIYDGTDDREKKTSNTFGLTTQFTIEMWIKPTNLTNTNKYALMISKRNVGMERTDQLSIIWEYVNNTLEVYVVGQTGDNLRTDSQVVLTAAWRHVVYSYDGSTWIAYLDGVEQKNTSKSTTLATMDEDYVLGCAGNTIQTSWTNFFAGSLDEVRISNIGRSVSYIVASYESERDDFVEYGTEETNIKNATLTVTELVGLYDPASTKTRGYFKTITELVGLLDSKSRIVGKVRSITELLGSKDLTTTKARSYFKTKIITEIVGLKDTFTKIRTGDHSITITEIMGFLDTVSFPRKPLPPPLGNLLGKPKEMMDKFLGWIIQTANPKIRGDVKINFGETEHTYGSLGVFYQTTVEIKGRVAEAFAETMPVTASLIQDFTETIHVKSNVMQTFTETINVCADLMKAVWFDGKLTVKSKLTTLKDYLEGLIQKIKETEETPEEKINDMRDELEEKEDDSN